MKKIEFGSLKIRRATDIIENRISTMILRGAVKSGEKLPTEKELSDQFDVSIVTIREALRGLEVAGLIEKKRGKGGGIYIREINVDSLKVALHNFLTRVEFSAHHLAQVRLTIEPTIVKIASSQITVSELAALENNLVYCETKLKKPKSPIPLKEYYAIGEKSIEFHKLISQATHNPAFVLTIDYLMDFIMYFRKNFFMPDVQHFNRVVNEHRDIFTHLKAGNAHKAEALMLSHLSYIDEYQMNEYLQSI
jgi:DNA-binding FadR family transcriptional regulator